MSETMAEVKRAEIEALKRQEEQDKQAMSGDMCPVCGQRAGTYPYICILPSPFGWLECPSCGTVYAPLSIRKQKLAVAGKQVAKPGGIISG